MATKFFARRPITHKGVHYRPGDEITGFTGWWRYWQYLRYAAVNQIDTAAYPVITSVVNGEGQATVNFTTVEVGGDPILDIEYSFDGNSWVSANTTDSPIVITGLDNGTVYSLSIRAINAAGPSASSDSETLAPYTVAAAPTSLVATPGDTQASIAFNIPTTDGGSAITNYKYRIGTGAWTAFAPPDNATPVVVTGLTNDVEVSITLRAVNARGDGAISDPVLVTPTA